jgi:hypothetical protein
MFLIVIPVIFFVVMYAYGYFSDDISAIEPFRTENNRDDAKEEETVARKSKQSEKSESKLIFKNCFWFSELRRSIRVNSTYISQKNRLSRYKTALATFIPFRYDEIT